MTRSRNKENGTTRRNPQRALVTGGAGFIGSHVVDRLLAEGWDVTAIDNFNDYYDPCIKEQNIAAHLGDPHFQLERIDIRDFGSIETALAGNNYNAIVHLAALAGVRPSIDDPASYYDVNVGGTQNLLEFARIRGIQQFVFASSSSVYGVSPRVPWSEPDAVLEPISPYASSKVSGELMGHVYSYLHGLRFVALRFFTVYGPRQRPDLAIHKFARLMLEGKPIPIYGDGTSRRDYAYIDDIADGVRAAMTYSATPYEVINLGDNRPVKLLDLVHVLEGALGVSARLDFLPDQPGDVPQTWANIEKAKRLLGYEPRTEFETGIKHFVDWLRRHGAMQK